MLVPGLYLLVLGCCNLIRGLLFRKIGLGDFPGQHVKLLCNWNLYALLNQRKPFLGLYHLVVRLARLLAAPGHRLERVAAVYLVVHLLKGARELPKLLRVHTLCSGLLGLLEHTDEHFQRLA